MPSSVLVGETLPMHLGRKVGKMGRKSVPTTQRALKYSVVSRMSSVSREHLWSRTSCFETQAFFHPASTRRMRRPSLSAGRETSLACVAPLGTTLPAGLATPRSFYFGVGFRKGVPSLPAGFETLLYFLFRFCIATRRV